MHFLSRNLLYNGYSSSNLAREHPPSHRTTWRSNSISTLDVNAPPFSWHYRTIKPKKVVVSVYNVILSSACFTNKTSLFLNLVLFKAFYYKVHHYSTSLVIVFFVFSFIDNKSTFCNLHKLIDAFCLKSLRFIQLKKYKMLIMKLLSGLVLNSMQLIIILTWKQSTVTLHVFS